MTPGQDSNGNQPVCETCDGEGVMRAISRFDPCETEITPCGDCLSYRERDWDVEAKDRRDE